MPAPRLISSEDGVSSWFEVDRSENRYIIRTTADVEPNLEANKKLYIEGDGYSPSRELQRVASIPVAVVMLWIERYGVDPTMKGHEDLLARLLNDPEWRYLRTAPGRV